MTRAGAESGLTALVPPLPFVLRSAGGGGVFFSFDQRSAMVSLKKIIAMVAARARAYYDKQAKERQSATLKRGDKAPVPENLPEREHGDARDQAAKAGHWECV